MQTLSYSIDSFYIIVCGMLVMFMTAGFTMLECGLTREKNKVEVLSKNIILFIIMVLVFYIFGYKIAFLGEGWGLYKDLYIGEEGTIYYKNERSSIHSTFSNFFFNTMFAGTSISIVSGVVAERFKTNQLLLFSVFLTLIYSIVVSWAWGPNGWLTKIGFYDFAGAGVVHLTGASAAMAGAIIVKARLGKYENGIINSIHGENLPLAGLGIFILWFGWFGFNGGSLLSIHGIENTNMFSSIVVNTLINGAAGGLGAYLFSSLLLKRIDITVVINGIFAGLIVSSAEPISQTGITSILIALFGGILGTVSTIFIDKLRIDDPVGAISIHGVVAFYALLMVPLLRDNVEFLPQLIGASSIFIFVFFVSYFIITIQNNLFKVRVSKEDEERGLSYAECGIKDNIEEKKEKKKKKKKKIKTDKK